MLLPILLLVCLWLRRRCVHTAASPAMPPPTMTILNVMMTALLQLLSIRRSKGGIAPFCYDRSIKAASISRRRPTLGTHLGAPRALRTLTNSATSRRSIPLTTPEPNDNLTKIQIHEDKYRLNPAFTSIHTHPHFTANIDTNQYYNNNNNKQSICPPQPLSPPPQPRPPPRSLPKAKATAKAKTA